MDPIKTFVTHFGAARFADLSPAVIETVKITILDTMGAALAGSASEAGRGIVRVVRRYGGGARASTLVVHGGKVAPPMAALANGVMARCLELDGTHETGGGHVGVCVVPAALALAEAAATPVSGRALTLGIALGVDMLCRLRMGAGKSKAIGWMAETLAPMSVAAMGSTLLGLPDDQVLDAIGIAYASCSGNVQPTVEGAWSLWTPAGTAAASGLLAIDMAREGFRGPRHPLLGEFGLYRLYFRGDYDEAALLGDLGERSEITNVSLKPYPTCKYTHHAIATALRLVETHGITADQVKRVTVTTNTMGATQCGFDAAGAPKIAPDTASAAKFSIPFTVAAAIARRRVTLAEFTDASIHDPELRQLACRVETRVDPAKDALPMLYPPMDVTIETSDGRIVAGCEEFVKGDPRNPFTFDDCVERFMAWAASAARPLRADDLRRFVTMIERLEDVGDVADLMPCLGQAVGETGP
ncbi:MAG TPA: MmgE/PrpD family protein [Candidatus Methylomirabilis sp.]|nr:MmgE/PrpD family protein [Candidatus Methylomirabilis sp.]